MTPESHQSDLLRRCLEKSTDDSWLGLEHDLAPGLRGAVRKALLRRGHGAPASDVEDYVQEIYCRLLTSRPEMRARGTFELWGYLEQTADSLVSDHLRTDRRQLRAVAELCRENPSGAPPWTAPVSSPERRTLARERIRRFFRHCRELSDAEFATVHLRILRLALIEGHTTREICQRIPRLSGSQVDSYISRLRGRLGHCGMPIALRRRRSRGLMPGRAKIAKAFV
jgi:RNA polymerase sigma factor (sigma-70 family)